MAEQIITPDAVEVYDRAIGPAPEAYHLADVMAWWEALPPVLRGFLCSLSGDRLDDTTLGAFADWLEEHGHTAEGQRVRLLRPQPGDVLVLYFDPAGMTAQRRAVLDESVKRLAEGAEVRGWIVTPSCNNLEAIDPEQLRAAGWVREEELTQHGLAVRERCARLAEALLKADGNGRDQYVSVHIRAIPAGRDASPVSRGD
jgi:uncharacterized protein (TIGR02996 family)